MPLECRSDGVYTSPKTEGHYLTLCLSSQQACQETVWLRRVRSGHVEMDVDVAFADGWLLRTVRVFEDHAYKGNERLSDVRLPDPKPQRP